MWDLQGRRMAGLTLSGKLYAGTLYLALLAPTSYWLIVA